MARAPHSSMNPSHLRRLTGCLLLLTASLWLSACGSGPSQPHLPALQGTEIALTNPSFVANAQGRMDGWTAIEHNSGNSYTFVADTENAYSAPSSLRMHQYGKEFFGAVQQNLRAQPNWIGRTVRLSGMLRSDGVTGGGGALVLQALNGNDNILGHNHMDGHRITGTTPWQPYSIEVKLPPNTYTLRVGVMLEDAGTLWADDLRLELLP